MRNITTAHFRRLKIHFLDQNDRHPNKGKNIYLTVPNNLIIIKISVRERKRALVVCAKYIVFMQARPEQINARSLPAI